jgi:DNA topoisomerase-1
MHTVPSIHPVVRGQESVNVMPKLVIVESPAKAKTIGRYLGPDYIVESSIGHIRDIPARAADAPPSLQDEWRRTKYGIDVDNDFKPLYSVTPDKKKQVTLLKKALKEADELYLATDEDREGEAIAWHLLEVLNPRVPVHRMVFHEITKNAIEEAVAHPRELDRRLVDAQEARRILDRLFGYEVSPVLWRKIRPRLSAGRVQSPAIRIVVERERERMAFVAASYWDIVGEFSVTDGEEVTFPAALVSVDDRKVATGRDFDDSGGSTGTALVLDEAAATALATALADAPFDVASVEAKPYSRRPYAPFRTSTLQQESSRKNRFGARRTMSAAQRLYEAGYITYMRTDSTTLSATALDAARRLVTERYGAEYLPGSPRTYGKVEGAQEAHEAIRPSGDEFTDIEVVKKAFGPTSDEARVYELIWKRTVASQMKDAKGESVQVRLAATATTSERVLFAASGKTITFPGFLRAYVEGSDDPDAALDDQETHLPQMEEGDEITTHELEAKGHETKPPARFTEASLVKRLEELGIGRPSTYASIIETIQSRDYVYKKGTALVPTFTAFATVALLESHFTDLVDYAFTAKMESDLDAIASGDQEAIPWLNEFYFGNGHPGLKSMVDANLEEIDAREINAIPIGEDDDGEEIVARAGRYGPYLQRGDDTVSLPDDLPPDEVTVEKAVELLATPSGDRVLGTDPETDLPVIAKPGRFGPYVQLGELEPGSKTKPKTASLFKTMSLDTVTMEEALRLLSQPREVGSHPEDGVAVTAQNGRYGPYLKWGKETRSLTDEDQIFTITLEEALELLAQPKRRGRAAAPLRELGEDPVTGKPVEVRNGRYGPYVTDGEHNASLRTGDTVEEITLERAAELLVARRERAAAKK